MFYRLLIAAIFIRLFLSAVDLNADQRFYVWTYQYQIMEAGNAELEQYTTFSATDTKEMESMTSTDLNFEFEIGMNDFFDFAIYQDFSQAPGGKLQYRGFKLRSRFKIGKKGEYILDPLIYVEYKGVPGFSTHEAETKLILAKDIGYFNISLNPYLEIEYEDKAEIKPMYALGISYQSTSLLHFGIEAKGGSSGNYIGPTISHGIDGLWFALGSLFGIGQIGNNKPVFFLRGLLGISL